MEKNAERPDEPSSTMEDLWGSREGDSPDDLLFSSSGVGGWGAGRRSDREARERTGRSIASEPDDEVQRTFSRVLEIVEARHAESTQLAKAELHAMRSHLDVVFGHIAAALAKARRESAAAEARVTEAEARFLTRMDEVGATTAEPGTAEVARVEQQVGDRLDRLAERQRSSQERVEAALDGIAAELADLRAAARAGDDARLLALEEEVRTITAEASELVELHAVLDIGLGALRSEIADVRGLTTKAAEDRADLLDRLEARADPGPAETPPQGRGRRRSREGELAQAALVAASTERVVSAQQELKADMARMEEQVQAAAHAARKATEVTALGPLRSEVTVLARQLAEQGEALDTLRKAVETLRRTIPPPAPARKRTGRSTGT